MTGFLIGVVSGVIVGGAASFVKNPLSGKQLRNDVKETVDNFNDSCHRVKNIYGELSEKNKKEDNKKSKVKVFADAFTAASFKALDHEKFFAAIKNKFSKTQEPVEINKEIDTASSASTKKDEVENHKVEKSEKPVSTDSISGASEHEDHN